MNITIIGLGLIAEKYFDAINIHSNIDIISMCDLEETNLVSKYKQKIQFYQDYKKIDLSKVDFVFITTPPGTHFEIASYFLKKKKNVLLEKPATLDLDSLNQLISIAKKNNTFFDVVFHWRYGNEVLYLKDHKKLIEQFKKITVKIFDPYMANGIKEEKRHLGGAWLDSGVNALSFLSIFLNLNQFKLIDEVQEFDPISQQDYFVKKRFDCQGKVIEIVVDWSKGLNHKQTEIQTPEGVLLVHHSKQSILLNNEVIYTGNRIDRLTTHYLNFFSDLETHVFDLDEVLRIHNILLGRIN